MFYHVSLRKVGKSDADEQVCQPCTVTAKNLYNRQNYNISIHLKWMTKAKYQYLL